MITADTVDSNSTRNATKMNTMLDAYMAKYANKDEVFFLLRELCERSFRLKPKK